MTPNHALFRRLFELCQRVCETYDYLPGAETAYPFIYIGEQEGSDGHTSDLYGSVGQTIHLYGLRTDRGRLDGISSRLETEVRQVSDGQVFHLVHRQTQKQVIPDNTDVQPLLHVVLDVKFDYTKKEN